MSGGTPDAVSQRTTSSRGTGGNGISTHRLAMVTRSGVRSSASSTKTDSPGGSSSVLSRTGARSKTRCTSSTTITWRARGEGPALGQVDDLADRLLGDGCAAPADDVKVGVRPGQRGPAGGALAAPAVRAQQRGGEPVGRRETTVAGRTTQEVGVDGVGRRRPQCRDRLLLAHHAGEE